jgi:transposase
MTGTIDWVEVITSVQRRRRWLAEEKVAIVQETYAPGMSVSRVARRHGIAPNQLFRGRRLYAEGALAAVGAGEEVVQALTKPFSDGDVLAGIRSALGTP